MSDDTSASNFIRVALENRKRENSAVEVLSCRRASTEVSSKTKFNGVSGTPIYLNLIYFGLKHQSVGDVQ